MAWRYVAYARGVTPELRKDTEAAARTVDDIAKPFPDHPGIQRERAGVWRLTAFAWQQVGDLEKAWTAVLTSLAICERFQHHPEADQFTFTEQHARELLSELDNDTTK